MRSDEALIRTARAVALAAAIGLLVTSLVGFGEGVHTATADRSQGEASGLDAPALGAEEAGVWAFAATLPALVLTPPPERWRRPTAAVRAASVTAGLALFVFLLGSMVSGADAANVVLLFAPPAAAGLMLAWWPFPDRSSPDRTLGRWGELLVVPAASYLLAIAAVLALRSSPVDWAHDDAWLIVFGPVALYGLLWMAAWGIDRLNLSPGSEAVAEDPSEGSP